jgi:2-phosphoglycerate kinase
MSTQRKWSVLLIGGPSGVGKTTVARQIGLRYGVPWLQVDDLRLALIRSGMTLPNGNAALTFFQDKHAWQLSPEQFCDGLIALGNVLSPAIEVVIENHVDTHAPLVIEGDALLPALFARPSVQVRADNGSVQAIFLIEPEEDVILANIIARGRSANEYTEAELRTEAHAKWLYGQWLANEAHRYGLPVVEARPWSTLVERIMTMVDIEK